MQIYSLIFKFKFTSKSKNTSGQYEITT